MQLSARGIVSTPTTTKLYLQEDMIRKRMCKERANMFPTNQEEKVYELKVKPKGN